MMINTPVIESLTDYSSVMNFTKQWLNGENSAATTVLAHREVLCGVGLDSSTAEIVARNNQINQHIAAIAICPIALPERKEIILATGNLIDNAPSVRKSGRSITLATLARVSLQAQHNAEFDGGSYKTCQQIFELQAYTRRYMPRLNSEQKRKKSIYHLNLLIDTKFSPILKLATDA